MVWSQTPRSDPNHIDIGEKSVVEGGSGRWFSWLKQGARSRSVRRENGEIEQKRESGARLIWVE
jgi:hypothetical protein